MRYRGGPARLLAAAGLLLVLGACGATSEGQPGRGAGPEPQTEGSGGQTPPEGCVPTTCEARGATCGTIPDGCEGTLTCGTCAEGLTCGGGGAPNTCGTEACTPTTCEAQGKDCGTISDGCGGTLFCGVCSGLGRCGTGGIPNVCEAPSCTPTTCEKMGATCGSIPDGCGGTLACGSCAEGETCGGGGRANHCGKAACTPTTCEAQGATCGVISDGCGGTLACGSCSDGLSCGGGGVPNQCGGRLSCVQADYGSTLPLDVVLPQRKDVIGVPMSRFGTVSRTQWTAPKTGTYVFDTLRSNAPSYFELRDGSCEGPILAKATASREEEPFEEYYVATVQLRRGQTVQITVWGDENNNSGDERLHIVRKEASEAGHCADSIDNDGDGMADCGDAECAGTEACRAAACTTSDLGSTLPTSVAASTLGEGNRYHFACVQQGGFQERAHRWTAPRAGTYVFAVENSAVSLAVLSSCAGATVACDGPTRSNLRNPAVKVDLEAGQSVVLLVQYWNEDSLDFGATYTLHVREWVPSEAGLCEDTLDNDVDGLKDEYDSDCAPTSCMPTTCEAQGATCGSISDGCGGTLACGNCGEGQECSTETHVCVAAPPQQSATRVWTFGERIVGLAGYANGSLVFSRVTPQGHALTRWDAAGNMVWEQAGVLSGFDLRHLSVAPATGGLIGWGIGWAQWGPWHAATRFGADGAWSGSFLTSTNELYTLSHGDADAGDNLVWVKSGGPPMAYGTSVTYARPDGTPHWFIKRDYAEPEPVTLAFRQAAFSPSGDIVVSANLYGADTLGGRTFSVDAGASLLVALTPTQQVRWAHQLFATDISRVATSASGRMVALARYMGSLSFAGTTLTSPPDEGGQALLVLEADGTPRALLPVSRQVIDVAVSPSGRMAVVGWKAIPGSSKAAIHVVEYAVDGTPSREWTLSPRPSTNIRRFGLTWAGGQLVVWGEAQGTMDFGTGAEVTGPTPEWSFIVKPG